MYVRTCLLRTMTPTLTITTAMVILPLTAATSFAHRGSQCLLTRTRSTSPPPRSVPCACALVLPVVFEPSLAARYLEKKTRRIFVFLAPPPSSFPGFTRGGPDDGSEKAFRIKIILLIATLSLIFE